MKNKINKIIEVLEANCLPQSDYHRMLEARILFAMWDGFGLTSSPSEKLAIHLDVDCELEIPNRDLSSDEQEALCNFDDLADMGDSELESELSSFPPCFWPEGFVPDSGLVTWDWKEQPNFEDFNRLLEKFGCKIELRETGSDQFMASVKAI